MTSNYRDEDAKRIFGGTSIEEVVDNIVTSERDDKSEVAYGMVDIAMSAVDDALNVVDETTHKGMTEHARTSRLLVEVLEVLDSLATGVEVVLLDNDLPLGTAVPEGADPNLAELHARLTEVIGKFSGWYESEDKRWHVILQRRALRGLVEKWGDKS